MSDPTDPLAAIKTTLELAAGPDDGESFGEWYAREHPEAPEWAKEIAADIGRNEERLDEIAEKRLEKRQRLEKFFTNLAGQIEENQRRVKAFEKQAQGRA